MQIYAGTSGYSYKEWKGPFYPEDLPAKQMLEYYGSQLPAVEINNTFYRMPKAEVLAGWAEQVPKDFRFVLKASRRITHFKRLKEAGDEAGYLIDTARTLGERLGVLLFQLPPNMKQDLERLESFLEVLPPPVRAAFEFRHSSWFEQPVYELLRRHGQALCLADTDDAEPELVATADWGYLRLRRTEYRKPRLQEWRRWIEQQDWHEAYVFFKHEDAGSGPKLAKRFLEMGDGRWEMSAP